VNTTTLITTILYTLTAAYLLYMAILYIFVYIANSNLGHEESFKMPLIYLISGIVFSVLSYLGYKIYKSEDVILLLKIIFYLPLIIVALYGIWAILLLLSAGGKWN